MREIKIGNVWRTDYGDIRCNAILKSDKTEKAYVTSSLDEFFIKKSIGNDLLNEDEIKHVFKKNFSDNYNMYVNLPKISNCSKLLQDVYDSVCLSDASMCHITEKDWENFYLEDYSNRDFYIFQKEIEKYRLKDVIITKDFEYKIIGYADLELRFNDDRFLNEKDKELEL